MMGRMSLAHVRGPSEPALLHQTIGAALRATARAVRGARGAGELRAGGPDDLRGARRRGRPAWRARCSRAGSASGDRVGVWSPNCAEWTLLQFATARVGAVLVNVNPAYRTSELAYALRQSGMRLLFAPRRFKTSNYADMVASVATPALEDTRVAGRRPGVGRVPGRRRAGERRAARRPRGVAASERPHQHPVHVGDDRRAQGRDALARQHPQQRASSSARAAATPRRTASASRCRSTTASGW